MLKGDIRDGLTRVIFFGPWTVIPRSQPRRRENCEVAAQMAGFARASAAGAWFSASPRAQRVAALHIAIVLSAALVGTALHRGPVPVGAPLALAAASSPQPAPADPVTHRSSARRSARPAPKASAGRQQKQASKPRDPGWVFWSVRIRGCESHGRPDARPDYGAQNPHSSASGAYQILDATWGGRYGVPHASDATPAQQEAVAAELYRQHGTAWWAASAPCWRR